MTYIPVILNARVGADAITADKVLDSTLTDADVAAANKDGAVGVASMRTIGAGALQAMAGNTTLDAIPAPTAAVDLNSQKITGLAAGTVSGDAVEFDQLNAVVSGLERKEAVDLASTANLTLSGEQTIDTILTSASRILVKDQTASADNGIYTTGAGAWTRTSDADSGTELDDGATVWVKAGSANGDSVQTQTLTVTVIGTNPQTWVQTGSATSVAEFSDLSDGNLTTPLDGQLLRYETSAGELQNTANAVLDDNGRLALPVTGATGGILIGGDAALYRSGADELRTPDSVVVDGAVTVAGALTANGVLDHEGMTGALLISAASPTLVAGTDYYVKSDSAAALRTVTLPTAPATGTTFEIKRVGSGNNVEIAATENIDGSGANYVLDVDYMAIKVVFDGTEWLVF